MRQETVSVDTEDADPALAVRVRAALGAAGAGPLRVLEGGRSGLTYVLHDGVSGHVVKAVPRGGRRGAATTCSASRTCSPRSPGTACRFPG